MSGRRRNRYIGDREVERYFRREAKERAREERGRDEQKEEAEEEEPRGRKPVDHCTGRVPGEAILSDGE